MRLAIVSDIHGNMTALEAVIADLEHRGVDRVVHAGDLVLGGCRPVEVIDAVRELGWPGIVGNTDQLLWRPEEHAVQARRAPKLGGLLTLLFDHWAPATRALLGDRRLGWLRDLPTDYRAEDLALVHASPGDLWRAPSPDAGDEELEQTYRACDARITVYGHIHRPFVRQLATAVIANSGAVGSPFDGDPRASYQLLENGRAQVVRVQYDVAGEARLLMRSGYPDAARIAETRRLGRYVAVTANGRIG